MERETSAPWRDVTRHRDRRAEGDARSAADLLADARGDSAVSASATGSTCCGLMASKSFERIRAAVVVPMNVMELPMAATKSVNYGLREAPDAEVFGAPDAHRG